MENKEGYLKTEQNGKFLISKISSNSSHFVEIELIFPYLGIVNNLYTERVRFFEPDSFRFIEPFINVLGVVGDNFTQKALLLRTVFENISGLPYQSIDNKERKLTLEKFPEIIETCFKEITHNVDLTLLSDTAKNSILQGIKEFIIRKSIYFFEYEVNDFQNIVDNILVDNDVIMDLSQGDNIYISGDKLRRKNKL